MQLTVLPAGWQCAADDGATLLLAAQAGGVRLPSSCRNGTCRTCICRLESGSVRYLIDWPGVSADEKRDGWILPCVAVAQSDVTLLAPAAKLIAT